MRLSRRLIGARWPHWTDDWLLGREERGNDATCLGPWTSGNSVRLLPHGSEYFTRLAHELEDTGPGDVVLVAGWRVDAEQQLDSTTTVAQALARSSERGASVRGLVWRSHPSWIVGSWEQNRRLAREVNRAGGQVLLDHRIRAIGSHHQKFVVIRRAAQPERDVAFVGGLDLARSRADSSEHSGDPLVRDFADVYGPTPAWHDVQVELYGPAVREVEEVFRERWEDPAPMTFLPWHRVSDVLFSRLPQRSGPLPPPRPAPKAQGRARVQLLRTYPNRLRGYPFAPRGELSVARGMTKALARARRLVYLEDQYMWSAEIGRTLNTALRKNPELHIVAVCPRYPDQEGHIKVPPSLLGQGLALRSLSRAVRDRVILLDPENSGGWPTYVHSKLCVIDDIWASVGSANLNRRSWTHDSELTVAVMDDELDDRRPLHPAGEDGDRARRFAREMRLRLMREHLDREDGDDQDLLNLNQAVRVLRDSATALDAWYDGGQSGPRPPGRLRRRVHPSGARWPGVLAAPLYHVFFDPDGRSVRQRIRRRY